MVQSFKGFILHSQRYLRATQALAFLDRPGTYPCRNGSGRGQDRNPNSYGHPPSRNTASHPWSFFPRSQQPPWATPAGPQPPPYWAPWWTTPPPCPYPTQGWDSSWNAPATRPSSSRSTTSSRHAAQAHLTEFNPLEPTDLGAALNAMNLSWAWV
ncbi:hypothetical protein E3N88_08746 [Mikania micrantha]|uniref:Uncharacterized protein n=1 Tax=Mikania micrantha TaxID=192012 RepID=A0A5N6PH28_9ASTR|nr:hypothetical protein E3N88_08746 [Mikania micrantha]